MSVNSNVQEFEEYTHTTTLNRLFLLTYGANAQRLPSRRLLVDGDAHAKGTRDEAPNKQQRRAGVLSRGEHGMEDARERLRPKGRLVRPEERGLRREVGGLAHGRQPGRGVMRTRSRCLGRTERCEKGDHCCFAVLLSRMHTLGWFSLTFDSVRIIRI